MNYLLRSGYFVLAIKKFDGEEEKGAELSRNFSAQRSSGYLSGRGWKRYPD